MPQFRQSSVGTVRVGGITPVAGARAGTVNDAGGLLTNVDCHNYKSVSLSVEVGVVGTSTDCKLQDSATSGGSYADLVPAAAITQITGSAGHAQLDAKLTPGRPWLQVVLVTVGASNISCAQLYAHGPMTTSRV